MSFQIQVSVVSASLPVPDGGPPDGAGNGDGAPRCQFMCLKIEIGWTIHYARRNLEFMKPDRLNLAKDGRNFAGSGPDCNLPRPSQDRTHLRAGDCPGALDFLFEFQTAIWLADLLGSLAPAAPTT